MTVSLLPEDGGPPPESAPPPLDGAPPPPAGDESGDDGTPPEAPERPEWLPEELWGEAGFNAEAFAALKAPPDPADLPSAAEAYELPAIEGVDPEALAADPVVAYLKNAAFGKRLGQGDFADLVEGYWTAESARLEAEATSERSKLGAEADKRLTTLSGWLAANLQGDELAAVRSMATTAAGVQALERLMNARANPAPRDPPPPPPVTKTEADIRKLMESPAYSGRADQRDPAVIKEVEEWFAQKYKE